MNGALRMLNIRPDDLPELPAGQVAGDVPAVVAESGHEKGAG